MDFEEASAAIGSKITPDENWADKVVSYEEGRKEYFALLEEIRRGEIDRADLDLAIVLSFNHETLTADIHAPGLRAALERLNRIGCDFQEATRRYVKKVPSLTDEQKVRFGPILQRTWQFIASSAEKRLSQGSNRQYEIIELTCNSDRPVTCGRMSCADYKTLMAAYRHHDTQSWLRQILPP
jgi:hypothetical protein